MLYHFVKIWDHILYHSPRDITYYIILQRYDIIYYITIHRVLYSRYDIIVANPSWYPPNPWYTILYSRFFYDIIVANPSWYPQIHDVRCDIIGFFYYIIDSAGDIIDSAGDIIDDLVCNILCDDLNISMISLTLSLLGECPNTTITLVLASPLPCCTRTTCLIVSRPVWQYNRGYFWWRHVAERGAGIMSAGASGSIGREKVWCPVALFAGHFTTIESESLSVSSSVGR